jgi:hypothetical protein
MLQFVASLGDHSGVPVFLETSGSGCEKFYGKGGFEVVERYPLKLTGNKASSQPPNEVSFNVASGGLAAMVRQPNSA